MEPNENKKRSNDTLVTAIVIVVVVSIVVALLIPVISRSVQKNKEEEKYPYVLVHGLMGYGTSSAVNGVVSYWGATAGRLTSMLSAEGYDVYEASVGPISSTWDRTCELYAQLYGGRVDYGAAHSEKHGHDRYGRMYEPLFEGMENDSLKVNLVGHSFGGETVRLLASLMEFGDETEQNACNDASPLFKGGKGEKIYSVTTLCSPHNGTTAIYVLDSAYPVSDLLVDMALLLGGTAGNVTNELFDFQLDHFGITTKKGEAMTEDELHNTVTTILADNEDHAVTDLSPDGAKKLNEQIKLSPHTYYISYAFSSTHEGSLLDVQVPNADTFALLRLPSRLIGSYSKNTVTNYPIDRSWLENDGLVNVVSAKYPFGDEYCEYTEGEKIQKGIWNVMPVQKGDHAKAVGMGVSSDTLESFFLGFIRLIEEVK
ncbi:MAG: lipase [Clostridia bacterium]|nr:lipase [Clostridia bacterium]